jgi:CheY-like chemotaxis protein
MAYVPRREASREPGAIRPSPLDTDMKASSGGAGGPDLAGVKVLVAEDEAIVAFDLEDTLRALGCSVRSVVATGAGLLDLVRRERPDVVLLDLGLADGFAGPLAAALRAEGVPFLLTTGYPPELFKDPTLREAPVLRKPYDGTELARVLAAVVGR